MRGVCSLINSRLGGPPSSESRPKDTNLGRARLEVSMRGGLRGDCGGSEAEGEASAAAVSLAREDDMAAMKVSMLSAVGEVDGERGERENGERWLGPMKTRQP
jgi:hypothetical protein